MKNLIIILTTTSSLLLTGCLVKKETIYAPAPQAGGIPAPGGQETLGPGDSGGGAGKNGKPLESFRVQIAHTDAYKKHLSNLMVALQQSNPQIAAYFHHVMNNRTWYVIPGPLSKIKGARMGVEFIETDQLALQNLNEVWIDQEHFSTKMSENDQALLILHELVMGARLKQFTDGRDKCYADIELLKFTEKDSKKITDARRKCNRNYPRLGGSLGPIERKISISKDDYPLIRRITLDLFEACKTDSVSICELNADDIQLAFEDLNFNE